jgi:hypothetical protein
MGSFNKAYRGLIVLVVIALVASAIVLFINSKVVMASESVFIIGNGTYAINDEIRQDTAPYIKNGRTYLPLRYAAYAVGIGDNSIYWEDNTKTAYLAKDDQIMSIRVGEMMIFKGTTVIITDAPAELVNGRVMLPLRSIAEALGCEVEWDGDNQRVIVRT